MERLFVRFLSSCAALATMAGASTPAFAAYGIDLGIHGNGSTSVQSNSTTSADINVRCASMDDEDQRRCERSARLQLRVQGNANLAGDSDANTVRSTLRARIQDARSSGNMLMGRARMLLQRLLLNLRTSLNAEAKVLLERCENEEGMTREQCTTAAHASLEAKVKAAIEAMKH